MIDLTFTSGVATITMARPPVNAIDDAFLAAFGGCLDELEQRCDVALVVIRTDQRCFSAGADLSQIRGFFSDSEGARRMVGYVSRFHALFGRIERLPAVTLAVINGPALGGGLELALSCDLRLAARSAKLGLPEARVGMIPGAGGTQRLTRLCGIGTASRLILTGEIVDGDEAERLGLVQWSVPDPQLGERVRDVAERVASARVRATSTFDSVSALTMETSTPVSSLITGGARSAALWQDWPTCPCAPERGRMTPILSAFCWARAMLKGPVPATIAPAAIRGPCACP